MENEELVENGTSVNSEVVGNVSETNEETESPIKKVNIDITINEVNYKGEVTVNTLTEEVDLGELAPDFALRAHWNGKNYYRVYNLLRAEALRLAECYDNITCCDITGFYGFSDDLVELEDGNYCFEELTIEWEDEYYYRGDCAERRLRRGDGEIDYVWAPDSFWDDCCFCEHCDCYIEYDDDYHGDGYCEWCYEDDYSIIEEYCESHEHEPIFFGDYKGDFIGLGFELEVDCDSDNEYRNNETAENLCSRCNLNPDEMRYAHDGSLHYGFECISQPHTIKAFWDKQDSWRSMLSYLAGRGYKSHDAGTCGLHVHVSRGMFGKSKEDQDRAIAKVFSFFDENWDEIVKVSRRRSFSYCNKNKLSDSEYEDTTKSLYEKWKSKSKWEGGHGVALNNSNRATFEYRLGRGTLNAWSFFSWIDFVITITKNARRINIDKVTSNDLLSWLGGIKESTAKYIYKRGAWRKEMLALYPNIEWETDLTESAEHPSQSNGSEEMF